MFYYIDRKTNNKCSSDNILDIISALRYDYSYGIGAINLIIDALVKDTKVTMTHPEVIIGKE